MALCGESNRRMRIISWDDCEEHEEIDIHLLYAFLMKLTLVVRGQWDVLTDVLKAGWWY